MTTDLRPTPNATATLDRPTESFLDGLRVQAVMEAALVSDAERKWAEVTQTF